MENSEINKLLGALSSTTGSINGIGEKIDKLNDSIKNSSNSSSELAKALNKLSRWGVIIAGSGVLIAAAHLVFNITKYILN